MSKDKLNNLNSSVSNKKDTAILSKLFRIIVKERNLLFQLRDKIDKYISVAHADDIKVIKRETRTQIVNSMLDEQMTWRTFIHLIFNVLRFKKLRLIVELTDLKGNMTMHEITTIKEMDSIEKIHDVSIKNMDIVLARLQNEVNQNGANNERNAK